MILEPSWAIHQVMTQIILIELKVISFPQFHAYQCLRLSSMSSMTTGWLQFNVFPANQGE